MVLSGMPFVVTACSSDEEPATSKIEEPVAVDVKPEEKSSEPSFEASRVIERVGGMKETPSWATGMEPMLEEKGMVVYIQTLTMEGNSRPEACLKAASDLGRAEFVRQIKDGITAAGQVTEGSATSDVAIESSVAYLSNLKLSGSRITGRYWEKFEESDSGSNRVLKIRCAAKVAISKSLLDQQIRKATETNSANPQIRKRLLDGQKAFLDQIAKEGVSPDSDNSSEE
jgi:hypothetical protein